MGTVELLGPLLLRGLGRTLRFQIQDAHHYRRFRETGRSVIFILWHARLLPLVYLHRQEGVVGLVSQHRDGEYIARVMQRMGFDTVRGSSTRGGSEALRELVRWLRRNRDLAITPDGPRGPARRVKAGVITVARLSGAPIIPVAAGSSRAWRARSWDEFVVPGPFARIQVRYGQGIHVPRSAGEEDLETYRRKVEEELNRLTDEVDGMEESKT
jgi:lysophospholipid acyltransferase (LPLAT)-like uncharacterized protein